MNRRTFLAMGAAGAMAGAAGRWWNAAAELGQDSRRPPAFSVIPVVGDGRWIWKNPPDDQTGYLEPRLYDVSIGIELRGQGPASSLAATTTLPVDCPEQKVEDARLQTAGCQAEVRQVGPEARQLVLRAPQIAAGQVISALWQATVSVCKQYHAYGREMFAERQSIPADVRRQYLGDSPGISTRIPEVRKLQEELSQGLSHPWDLAARFAAWVTKTIRPQVGRFTNVQTALTCLRGDCEEMSAVLLALCRAAGIPARLVWVPNHNWSEFYLTDQEGKGRWIPAHTACYFWFGWTGAHELVLQKGDRLRVPERHGYFRLLEDWMQWMGRRPAVRYLAELRPRPPSPDADPGPGARRKVESGEWQLLGNHPMDRYMRR